jgi:hypothetical protein
VPERAGSRIAQATAEPASGGAEMRSPCGAFRGYRSSSYAARSGTVCWEVEETDWAWRLGRALT